ncbi:MAG: hypothetical protein ABIH86_05520 [Planctomycetota bacterium]
MRRSICVFFVLLIICVNRTAFSVTVDPPPWGLNVGETAKSFTGATWFGGKPLTDKDVAGKFVVVVFSKYLGYIEDDIGQSLNPDEFVVVVAWGGQRYIYDPGKQYVKTVYGAPDRLPASTPKCVYHASSSGVWNAFSIRENDIPSQDNLTGPANLPRPAFIITPGNKVLWKGWRNLLSEAMVTTIAAEATNPLLTNTMVSGALRSKIAVFDKTMSNTDLFVLLKKYEKDKEIGVICLSVISIMRETSEANIKKIVTSDNDEDRVQALMILDAEFTTYPKADWLKPHEALYKALNRDPKLKKAREGFEQWKTLEAPARQAIAEKDRVKCSELLKPFDRFISTYPTVHPETAKRIHFTLKAIVHGSLMFKSKSTVLKTIYKDLIAYDGLSFDYTTLADRKHICFVLRNSFDDISDQIPSVRKVADEMKIYQELYENYGGGDSFEIIVVPSSPNKGARQSVMIYAAACRLPFPILDPASAACDEAIAALSRGDFRSQAVIIDQDGNTFDIGEPSTSFYAARNKLRELYSGSPNAAIDIDKELTGALNYIEGAPYDIQSLKAKTYLVVFISLPGNQHLQALGDICQRYNDGRFEVIAVHGTGGPGNPAQLKKLGAGNWPTLKPDVLLTHPLPYRFRNSDIGGITILDSNGKAITPPDMDPKDCLKKLEELLSGETK